MFSKRKQYAIKEKPYIPQGLKESGEYPCTPAAIYLQDRDWSPFKFEGEIRWIDPLRPFDLSKTEADAIAIQWQRDELKEAGWYSETSVRAHTSSPPKKP